MKEMHLSLVEVERALRNLSPRDWRVIDIRAKTYSHGLVFLSAEDLIHETYVELLSGGRAFPADVSPIVVVIQTMHSVASNCRDREKNGAINHHVELSDLSQSADEDECVVATKVESTDVITPERILAGRQEIDAILKLVEDDADQKDVATAWAMGIRGREAPEFLGWDEKRYDSARKRFMRQLDGKNRVGA